MNTKRGNLAYVVKLCECAILIALAIVLDYASKFIFAFLEPLWPGGGGITLCMIPMVFISLRHGSLWGILSAFAYSGLQILSGWYTPAGGIFAIILCVLLDYVVAYSVLGSAEFFAKRFKNRLVGYGMGAFIVVMLRFICSFLSGAILWGSWMAWEGFTNVWLYSFCYNLSYLLPNAILTALLIVALCIAIDPKTLKRYPKK